MRALKELIEDAEKELHDAPDYTGDWHVSWDDWFARNARYFRRAIGELIMKAGGTYEGEAGLHSLDLGDVFVIAEDGYRGLLVAWLAAAREAVAYRQAVPA
jgi:hypothetical protein